MKKPIPYDIYIRDISEGNETGYKAVIPKLGNAIVYGGNFREIEKGIRMTDEAIKTQKIKTGNTSQKMDNVVGDRGESNFIIKLKWEAGSPTYQARIPALNVTVFGNSFNKLEDAIRDCYSSQKSNCLKSIPKLTITVKKNNIGGLNQETTFDGSVKKAFLSREGKRKAKMIAEKLAKV
jgi:hypothetical protein